jgi:hypothetical protein
MDVVRLGTSDKIISGKPEATYFIQRYSKTSQFASQIIRLQFPISVSYGEETEIELYQEGDLIKDVYLNFLYPSGQPSVVCDSFGTYMLNWAQLEYGDQIIERIDGEFLEMTNDLTVPQTKQSSLSNLVGKSLTSNLSAYYVKLPFSVFDKGLPVCALKENPRIRLSLRNFVEGSLLAGTTNPPFTAALYVNYIFLPEPEKNYFIKNELTILFNQTQRYDLSTFYTSNVTVYTEFQNPTKELFFVIQDFGSDPYTWTSVATGAQQLLTLRMLLNNAEVITTDMGTPLFLRALQGLENHTRCPDRYFYMYSFALDPENINPSGSVNMSCLRQQFDFVLVPTTAPYGRTIHIYARNYNILKIKDGLLRVLYPVPFQITGTPNSRVNNTPPTTSYMLALSNPGTLAFNTVGSSNTFSMTLTNPYNVPVTWSPPVVSGLSVSSTTNKNIVFTVAQGVSIASQSVTVSAQTTVAPVSQSFTISATNNPYLVWGTISNKTVVTVLTSQSFSFNIANYYLAPINWSYTSVAGLTAVTTPTSITFTVAQGTAISQTISVTASCFGTYFYPMSFGLTAVNDPGLVLENPGTQTLNTTTGSQFVSAFLTNSYSLPISWTYTQITGVTVTATTSGISFVIGQGVTVTSQTVTMTATCGEYQVSQSFTLSVTGLFPILGSSTTYEILTGVSGTNTTTGINYFDTRDTIALGGANTTQYPFTIITGSIGQLLTFILRINTGSATYNENQSAYVNYGTGWVQIAAVTNQIVRVKDVTITYTIPAGTSPGQYSIVFQNDFSAVTAPTAVGVYKSAREYVLKIV